MRYPYENCVRLALLFAERRYAIVNVNNRYTREEKGEHTPKTSAAVAGLF